MYKLKSSLSYTANLRQTSTIKWIRTTMVLSHFSITQQKETEKQWWKFWWSTYSVPQPCPWHCSAVAAHTKNMCPLLWSPTAPCMLRRSSPRSPVASHGLSREIAGVSSDKCSTVPRKLWDFRGSLVTGMHWVWHPPSLVQEFREG